jgi:hypothetical protein
VTIRCPVTPGGGTRRPGPSARRRGAAPAAWFALPVLAVVASGCDSIGSLFEDTAPPPCPRIAVVPDANTITKFRAGPGRDIIDILYEGKIANVIVTRCEKNSGDSGGAAVSVDLSVWIEARRGAADRDHEADFAYFVAVAQFVPRPEGRAEFTVRIPFEGNRSRVVAADTPVTVNIPLARDARAAEFEIVVGFRLSAEDLEYNRRRHEGAR